MGDLILWTTALHCTFSSKACSKTLSPFAGGKLCSSQSPSTRIFTWLIICNTTEQLWFICNIIEQPLQHAGAKTMLIVMTDTECNITKQQPLGVQQTQGWVRVCMCTSILLLTNCLHSYSFVTLQNSNHWALQQRHPWLSWGTCIHILHWLIICNCIHINYYRATVTGIYNKDQIWLSRVYMYTSIHCLTNYLHVSQSNSPWVLKQRLRVYRHVHKGIHVHKHSLLDLICTYHRATATGLYSKD